MTMFDNKALEEMHGGVPEVTEVDKLIDLLNNCVDPVPFEITTNHGRPQVWFPSKDDPVCDAICHWASYGHQDGLIEIMGLTKNNDTVEGYLSAWEVFARIVDYYTYHKDKFDF